MSRLGVVVFGASGFTGKYVAVEMARVSKQRGVSWGIAGRSRDKLEAVLRHVTEETGEDQSHIQIIIADVTDKQSLRDMCMQAEVIANCCGPYHLYGEPVIAACITAGSHYVDITGEPQFIELMELRYDDAARAAGVYVVSSCGFDSIPNDLGTVFLQQQFGGILNSVESYMWFSTPVQCWPAIAARGVVHAGSWESLVHGLANYGELKPLRQNLYPDSLTTFKPELKRRWLIHKRSEDGGWSVPFPGADASIVQRTQRARNMRGGDAGGPRPAHFHAYYCAGPCLHALALLLWAAVVYLLSRFPWVCRLMTQYPRVFTGGLVTHAGPAPAVAALTRFSVKLYGEGWSEGGDLARPPDKRVVAKVSGRNPGYGATAAALVHSAVTMLHQRDRMPGKGGVLTTGYAFGDTDIITHLSDNMKFEIVETSKIN